MEIIEDFETTAAQCRKGDIELLTTPRSTSRATLLSVIPLQALKMQEMLTLHLVDTQNLET